MKKKLLEKRKETKLMIPLLFVKLLSTTRKQIKNHKNYPMVIKMKKLSM